MGVNKPDSKFFEIIFEQIKNKDKSSILMIGDDLTTDIHIPKQYTVLLFTFLNFSNFIL